MISVKCKWENTETGAILHEILTFESVEDAEKFIEENRSVDKNKNINRVIKEAKIIQEASKSDSAN
ncbi:MAG TPA: hypothetical protein VKA34_12000 [Balneolales bacterium]|nr:hypothetical protein [Balneolales bacterium]